MHTQALSDRLLPTADAGLQPTFSCFIFSQFLDFSSLMNNTCSYTIKGPCVFSIWPIWAFINNAKHRHLEFLLLIPMEKNHFLPSSCISLIISITCLQTTYYRISFELTKPNHSHLALLVPRYWSSLFLSTQAWSWVCEARAHECETSLPNSQSWTLVKGFAKG